MMSHQSLRKNLFKLLLVFFSFIFGFIVTEFLAGWSYFLKVYLHSEICSRQFAWSLLAFLFLIQGWWAVWKSRNFMERSFWHFLCYLLIPINFYIMGTLFFPLEDIKLTITSCAYFDGRQRYIFGSAIMILFLQALREKVFEGKNALSLSNAFRVAGTALLSFLVIIQTTSLYSHIVIDWIVLSFCCVVLILFIALRSSRV